MQEVLCTVPTALFQAGLKAVRGRLQQAGDQPLSGGDCGRYEVWNLPSYTDPAETTQHPDQNRLIPVGVVKNCKRDRARIE